VVAATRAILLLLAGLLALGCFALGGPVRDRDSFWLLITNGREAPIIVRPAAPIDNSGAWVVQPDETGPYAYASAGTNVDVLTQDCVLIGRIVLPTRFNSGEPEYTVRPDGVIERHDNPLAHLGDLPPVAAQGQDLCPLLPIRS
jgi:hypothetical protein